MPDAAKASMRHLGLERPVCHSTESCISAGVDTKLETCDQLDKGMRLLTLCSCGICEPKQ